MELEADLEGYEESLETLSDFVEKEERALQDAMEYVLRMMVNHAKDKNREGTWEDHTSNLRNSISVNLDTMKEYPADTDPSVLEAVADENKKPVIEHEGETWKGAISAGMEYAIWLETKSGYSVLQGTIDAYEPVIDEYFGDKMEVDKIDVEEVAKQKYKELYG